MYPDFKELLSVLNEHQVKYLVVGAYALSIHAQPRATKDLDPTLQSRALFSVWDTRRLALIFLPKLMALILTLRGKSGLKALLMLRAV